MTLAEFPGPGLSEEQWRLIRSLAVSLSSSQLSWVSGYFAGFDEGTRGRVAAATPQAPEPAAPPQAAARTLTILFGSETGASQDLAATLARRAEDQGLPVRLFDMGAYKVRQLKDEQDLLLISSTHGEGDPPQAAADFFEFLESRKAPRLEQARFSVLALGDSTYERFCEAGRRLDRRLEELGARRFEPRADCDVDYEEPAAAWMGRVLSHFAAGPATPAPTAPAALAARPEPTAFDRKRPFPAAVIDNLVLTGRGSSKETRHLELSLEGSGLTFEPGDALGLHARNDPAVVAALLDAVALSPEAPVSLKGGDLPLGEALESAYEVTAATPRFLEQWAQVTGAAGLKALLGDDGREARSAFLRGHQVIDIVRAFPAPGVAPVTLLAGLRPLQPRLYSIASSPLVAEDEAHLTVSTVRFALHGTPRSGVASGHIADRLGEDATLPAYIQPNPHFRLPEPERPILMIGAGTGVAPFRAFMQHREAQGTPGRSWLVLGERNFRTDFLYQTEWQALLRDQALTRMDVAFSRDGDRKLYVQHRLLEHAAEVYAWIEDGACVYVCGDAARLAPDVHEALATILVEQGRLSREDAEERLRGLAREHRYQRDVY
ncbi:assimilatory sulfite reductase (NADPH) flavoprotein subunit [Phenylobacterium sp.]|uniref:assimilatory sulfite reductase (NADPH) flavoprotein subunit n=1 Tax=Phenylobacterium sp. TaxID=1871053 RepID=UPI00301D5BF9